MNYWKIIAIAAIITIRESYQMKEVRQVTKVSNLTAQHK
jgi:hypothetical protein